MGHVLKGSPRQETLKQKNKQCAQGYKCRVQDMGGELEDRAGPQPHPRARTSSQRQQRAMECCKPQSTVIQKGLWKVTMAIQCRTSQEVKSL